MLRVATAFSGIGAPEWALKRMGIPYETVFACDNGDIDAGYDLQKEVEVIRSLPDWQAKKKYVDELYAKTKKKNFVKQSYLANHNCPEERFFLDVCLLDGTDFRDQVDLFIAGSPCQSFSVAGYRRGFDDQRGQLFFEFCRLVDEIQPKIFVWENVKGVLSHNGGKTWATMKESFESLGYKVFHQVLNAKDYGIPQSRPRMFVVGFKDHDADFEFPKPVPLTTVMKDYLDGFANSKYLLTEKGVEFVTNPEKQRKQFTQVDGDVALCQKKCQQTNLHGDFVTVDKKYFLSQKMIDYVLNTGTKGFHLEPKLDNDIAFTICATYYKMHRGGLDNYVTDIPVDEKYFLTDKMKEYVLNCPCGGYNNNPELDREIGHTLTSTMHKMKNASTDNYVTDLKFSTKGEDDE